MRSGSEIFSILALLETLLGPPGDSQATFGVSWPPLRLLLEVSWELLGRSWSGALGTLLGRSWPDFDAILGVSDRS